MIAAVVALLAATASPLAPLDFLQGKWIGEGAGAPGQGKGWFTFTREMGGNVLVRRAHTEYPGAQGGAAFQHEDLLIVYQEPGEKGLRAIYFDGEGHVIHYTVEAEGGTARFLSEAKESQPRFRLTYTKSGESLGVKFEIAPPGQPEAFKTYVEGTSRRASGGPGSSSPRR